MTFPLFSSLHKVGNDLFELRPEYKRLEFLLSYVVASDHEPWAKELASKQSKLFKKMPPSVYFYSNDPWLTNELKAFFPRDDGIDQTIGSSV